MSNFDETAVKKYITDTFAGVVVATAFGDSFFIYDTNNDVPPERQFPFATLVTGDNHDTASNLSRPGIFRLNIGVEKETYRSMFGPQPSAPAGPTDIINTGHDFTTLDQVMPHPVYAPQSWVSVLNPSDATLETVKSLLAEAHKIAVRKHGKGAQSDS
jgi:hypothetical protein